MIPEFNSKRSCCLPNVFLESVFHEDEVSSLNKAKARGIFFTSSFMKATYRRKYVKRRIVYSYGHPGSSNPTVIENKEAYMIQGNLNNETGTSQATGFSRKQGRKFLSHQPVYLLVKWKGKTGFIMKFKATQLIIFRYSFTINCTGIRSGEWDVME